MVCSFKLKRGILLVVKKHYKNVEQLNKITLGKRAGHNAAGSS